MRFLLIANDFPNPGEPTKGIFNLYLARALARQHEVRVISPVSWLSGWKGKTSPRPPSPGDDSATMDGLQVYYPRYFYPPKFGRTHYGWFLWQSIRGTVWRVLRSYRPDAVVGYWAHPDGEAAVRVARLLGVPSAVIVGGSDVLLLPKDHRRRQCVVNVLSATDAVLAVSRDLQASTVKLGIPAHKVHVWSQGVDTDTFAPGDRSEARRRLGVPLDAKALLWVGRMHPVKAVDVLVDASARLRSRGTDFRLYLVGDGPLRQSLEAQVRAAALSDRVCFVGPQDHRQLGDWYRAADLTVLPSWSEGIPNTLRESLACGTPFVASRVGGIPEIADEPANRLVPPGDSAALADALDRGLAERGAPGPARSRSGGWAASAASLVAILEPFVSASQAPDRPWWSGKHPATIKPETALSRFGIRQCLRKAMAALLPHRLLLVRGRPQTNAVSFTFDDGPHPEHTPRVLDTLRRQGIRATFFVVGRQAERYPDLVRRIAAEGHDVANHSFFHAETDLMSAREAVEGVLQTQQLLRRLVGEVPSLYRPPRGKLSLGKLLRLWWAGIRVVLWNVDPRDYACESSAEMAGWFRRNPLRGGDVVLFHDRLPLAAEVLPELIEATRQRGLAFVPVSHWTR
jgi:glycosyltransferase involved in cell wall biosynthesis/peptidoglycan/xylan/chitin deacetylase (PgdA/CDA1 family)